MQDLSEQLQKIVKGEVIADSEGKKKFRRDTSIFDIEPQVVVAPAIEQDIQNIVNFVRENKKKNPELSITARSAGTDMSGGTLTDSIMLDFIPHFNHLKVVRNNYFISQPGVYFRDIEKKLTERGKMYPPYPASKDLCAVGGLVNNNSGGEKTYQYGKTNKFIEELEMVLSDGKIYTFKKLTKAELEKKMQQKDFEGEIYRKMWDLVIHNQEVIKNSRPQVSKNSSGYNIWDIWDGEHFDLTQVICGAQGTLGILTQAEMRIVHKPKHEKLYVAFMKNMKDLPQFVNDVLPLKPTSVEITDEHTFKIYLRYAREMASILGTGGLFNTMKLFWPETKLVLRHGMPKLITLVEFEGDETKDLNFEMNELDKIVKKYKSMTGRKVKTKLEAEKYWKLRRDTFKLLREKIKDKHSTPFVDDLIVKPQDLPEFWPQLTAILDEEKLFYTVSGHLADGNLHIIPVMDLRDPKERAKIYPSTDKVYDLIFKYKGSITAEHNDGLIRGPYLEKEFGKEVFGIFKEIKQIFDPENIFNPHKKTGATLEYAKAHMITD